MFPTLNDLGNKPENPLKPIKKIYFPEHDMVGVMVRKIGGEIAGMVAWRLYRTKPLDGVTEFGRAFNKYKNYYITGGYTFSYQEAESRLRRAVDQLA